MPKYQKRSQRGGHRRSALNGNDRKKFATPASEEELDVFVLEDDFDDLLSDESDGNGLGDLDLGHDFDLDDIEH